MPLSTDPSIRRSSISPNELISRPDGDELKIVGDIFSYIVSADVKFREAVADSGGVLSAIQAKKYGNRTACSYRNIVDIVEEKKMVPASDGSGEEEKVWK